LPHAFVDFARFIYKLAPARSLSIRPHAYVVVSVGVDVPAIAVIDVILELALVDYVVNLFAYPLNSAIVANLADDVWVVLGLAELQGLVNSLTAVLDDILKFQRPELCPLVFDSSQGNTWHFLLADHALVCHRRLWSVELFFVGDVVFGVEILACISSRRFGGCSFLVAAF